MKKLLLLYPSSILKLLTGWILLVFFTVSGCKKDDITLASTSNNLDNKIVTYLESQKITDINGKPNLSNKNANIDLLKESLDFAKATTEQLDDRLDLLVVPIKDDMILKKILTKIQH